MTDRNKNWTPFIYFLLIAVGIIIGMVLKPAGNIKSAWSGSTSKMSEVLSIVAQSYVDSVNVDSLEDAGINDMLANLDPHSVYLPPKELTIANEQLEGNFEGIGVEFNIVNDTIMVVAALNGGPSQELGIQPGDRIVKVNAEQVAGNGITNDKVFKLLRGPKGSEVKVDIYRPSAQKIINYTIIRNTIPIYSVDAGFMLNPNTGYIKISRFAEKTHEEFLTAAEQLKKQGMTQLILDLRGNPGGYLSTATSLADEFLDDDKLIVYTKGRTKPTATYNAQSNGIFENGKLVVLIDEGSASASEIVSGAIQDWDRGVVVGRRSFGKGLVQEPFEIPGGGALRLTVSRYFTPSGRCIQKDYKHGADYDADIIHRYQNGELEDANKAAIFDSTPYTTQLLKRTVYGGGGIYPDVFVPIDTSYVTSFLTQVISNALIGKFAYDYLDKNRKQIETYTSLTEFSNKFNITESAYNEFLAFTGKQNIAAPTLLERKRSDEFIKTQMKALIARQIWRDQGYYTIMHQRDKAVKAAINAFNNYYLILNKGKR